MSKLPKKIINLNRLKKICLVPNYIYFKYDEYLKNKKKYYSLISEKFKKKIIIRSAAFDEDRNYSNAGKYLSVGNILKENFKHIDNSIVNVFLSYKRNTSQYVIIQEYIDDAEIVGVIFSKDPKNGSLFRTINFNSSKKTSLITSGVSNGKIIYYYKNYKKLKLNKNIYKIEKQIRNLEKNFKYNALDIEFLIKGNKIQFLQIRELFISNENKVKPDKALLNLNKKLKKLLNEPSNLIGKERIFSTMTDWNPAEIIGLKPKNLALSLYKSLITENIWCESRVNLGYKNIHQIPLMYTFMGTPFVDLRTDINSFLLDEFNNKIQLSLIKLYFKKFKKKPYFYYDKIESNLVLNCISLNLKKYKNLISKVKLSDKEKKFIINKYLKITENIIFKLDENVKKYNHGEKLFSKIKLSKTSTINKIYTLHNLCKLYGTLPFANIARMSFIAIEFLNSMVDLKIISSKEKSDFLEGNKSISYEMSLNLKKNKKEFLKKYGHLRPNTYEISNLNYKDNYKNYFISDNFKFKKKKAYKFKKKQIEKINLLLKKIGFKNINFKKLYYFISNSIYQREASKLFFTKIIDELFNQLKILSNRIGLNKNEIQYININEILDLYDNFDNDKIIKKIKENIKNNIKLHSFNDNFQLPNIISKSEDIFYYEEEKASPTFITNNNITGKILYMENSNLKKNLNNKIICIQNADPGFDFIFNHNIKGLITAFGGPNSHMAIRCNEFNIPSVIGIGEKKFLHMVQKKSVYLNCKKKLLIIL